MLIGLKQFSALVLANVHAESIEQDAKYVLACARDGDLPKVFR